MFDDGVPYRPVPLAVRQDLKLTQQAFRGETYWVVADPLAIEFYRFNEQEFALLTLLDGRRSLDEIKSAFERDFSPFQISYEEISSCLADFYQKSLLRQATANLGGRLHRLGRKAKRKKRLRACANFMSLKLPGVNPASFLQSLSARIGWLFSWPLVVMGCLLACSAGLLLATHATEFQAKLPAMQEFFSGSNLVLLSLTLIFMKICHELGHGVVCARHGGRCHELGLMFLVFMPTLYVDTSDSWRMPSKWSRIAIAAAGMYVELVLAAFATLIWWNTAPGALHYLCLNVLLLGTVSTFLFNGNPLLKFDGYFILSDLIEIPNLQQRSSAYLRSLFLGHGLGIAQGEDRYSPWPVKAWLVGYGLAAYCFRLMISYWIALTIVYLFRPAGLGEVAKLLGLTIIGVGVMAPVFSLIKYFWVPGRWSRVDCARRRITVVALITILAFVCLVPLPQSVVCDFVVKAENAATVYVKHEGLLENLLVELRHPVRQNQPVAKLRNVEVEIEYEQQLGEQRRLQEEMNTALLLRSNDAENMGRLRLLRTELATVEARLEELEQIRQELVLRSPRDGYVMPSYRAAEATPTNASLESWDGWALAAENQGTLLRRGERAFVVGDPNRLGVQIILAQDDVRRVAVGQRAELMFDDVSMQVASGTITEVSEAATDFAPQSLVARHGGVIAGSVNQQFDQGEVIDGDPIRVAEPVFEATMPLPKNIRHVAIGTRGKAKVVVQRAPLIHRFARFVRRTVLYDF